MEVADFGVAPGTEVSLNAIASDPDGDKLSYNWIVYEDASKYSGAAPLHVFGNGDGTAPFSVPADAQPGDIINLVVEVTDDGAPALTRYGQAVVTVIEVPTE